MAIAISDFEALCGFITAPELAEVLLTYPEIHPCIGASSIESAVGSSGREQQKEELKQIFTSLMTCDSVKVCLAVLEYLFPCQKHFVGEQRGCKDSFHIDFRGIQTALLCSKVVLV